MTSTGTCMPCMAALNFQASALAAPPEVALMPPRLNMLAKSDRISVKSCLLAAMACAVAVGPGGVPPVAGAAVQALPVQARLASTTVRLLGGTAPASAGSASTVLTARASAAETSVPPFCSLIEPVLAAAASASVTHRVLSPAVPVLQPRPPSAASLDTAVSIRASCCADVLAPAAVEGAAALSGLKPSNCETVDTACAVLAAVMPPVARVAAAATISLKGVTVVLTVTAPPLAGTPSARKVKPAGSGWLPLISSRWVVVPSALALMRIT